MPAQLVLDDREHTSTAREMHCLPFAHSDRHVPVHTHSTHNNPQCRLLAITNTPTRARLR